MKFKPMINGIVVGVISALALPIVAAAQDFKLAYAPVGSFEPLLIAQEKGWFKEAGLDVELIRGSRPSDDIARLLSGEIDIAATGSIPGVSAISNGVPIQFVFGSTVASEIPNSGLVVRDGDPYHTVNDLKGKRVGMFGTQGQGTIMMLRSMYANGMEKGDIEFQNLPNDTHIENLKNGNVEAIIPLSLYYGLALENPDFRAIDEPSSHMVGLPSISYVATKRFADENADKLQTLISVLERAYAYANENELEVRETTKKHTRLPHDFIDKRRVVPSTIHLVTEQLERLGQDMVTFGLLKRAPSAEELVWSGAPTR
ncbi:ABC transporter substrate-binding protein [Cognatishimia sp. SS12]|uniref:ABC transporter substrate-binding protein n=1 Tax=Cognatishimia sp. SS12 TaxID=2979465 RepID=UPI00232C3AB8|nr:ABC transporter substrate-binding protein [Cognatishimia sp. SS12]MDC0739385.1 ABC transporter substrate-binding protein [Cognatishimia sp. SS12]